MRAGDAPGRRQDAVVAVRFVGKTEILYESAMARRMHSYCSMRYVFGLVSVCALAVVLPAGCTPTGSANSFEIVRAGEDQSYDRTSVVLRHEEPQLILYASISRDDPSIADDERWYYLWVVFDAAALADLATEHDDPISGEASWTGSEWPNGVKPEDVTFVGTAFHTVAIEKIFFGHCRGGCWIPPGGGTETIQGTLRLTLNALPRLAGVIEVRVGGDIPGTEGTYDLTLTFDQTATVTDAGTDAGADAGTDGGTDGGTDAGTDAGTNVDAGIP